MAEDEDKRRARQAREMLDYLSQQRATAAQTATPSRLAAGESGAIGARSIERQMAQPNRATLTIPTGPVVGFPATPAPAPAPAPTPTPSLTPKPAPTPAPSPTPTPTPQQAPAGTDPALFALLQQLQQQNLQAQLAAQAEADRRAAEARAARQSAYDLLYQQFSQYGLGALVEPLKGFITSGINPSEFTIRLRETDAYKKRFAANQQRIAKGLRALSEAEYIGLEDQYQDVMRRYGLPETYYTRGEMGRQEGFEKFIAGDVSPVELEQRLQIGQNRIINAPKEVLETLRQFYGDQITNGDALAYVLDTEKALENIKRKVTAAEIGAGAAQAGLATGLARAEELGRFGVTGEQARQGFSTIAEFLPSAQKLSDIYSRQGLGPYTQETAEQEVFGITGAAEAGRKRRKLTELETAAFSGTSGIAGGALARDRAGAI